MRLLGMCWSVIEFPEPPLLPTWAVTRIKQVASQPLTRELTYSLLLPSSLYFDIVQGGRHSPRGDIILK